MHYGARYYHPLLDRFISTDTIVPEPGEPQDFNRYAYVRNNPVLYRDPSGHMLDIGGSDPRITLYQPILPPTPPPMRSPAASPTAETTAAPAAPNGWKLVDDVAGFLGVGVGDSVKLPAIDISNRDILIARVTYQLGVEVVVGDSPVTIYSDRAKLDYGDITVQYDGEDMGIRMKTDVSEFSTRNFHATNRMEAGISLLSAEKFTGGKAVYEFRGQNQSIAIKVTYRRGQKTSLRRLATAVAIAYVPAVWPHLVERFREYPAPDPLPGLP